MRETAAIEQQDRLFTCRQPGGERLVERLRPRHLPRCQDARFVAQIHEAHGRQGPRPDP